MIHADLCRTEKASGSLWPLRNAEGPCCAKAILQGCTPRCKAMLADLWPQEPQ